MACPISLSGIQLGCKDAIAGVSEFYVIDKNNITATPTLTNGVITTISTGVNNFSVYKVKKQTASFVQTATITDANDNYMFTNDLIVKFNKLETSKRTELEQLIKGQLAIIIKLNNGSYWFMGYDNEVTVTTLVGNSGVAFGDANGYDVTFQDLSFKMCYEVSSSVITALIS